MCRVCLTETLPALSLPFVLMRSSKPSEEQLQVQSQDPHISHHVPPSERVRGQNSSRPSLGTRRSSSLLPCPSPLTPISDMTGVPSEDC
ncbi:hypothetical protein VZT92_003559 [Zoarces viviparus]|uniref:Uncharacterized protein n=1 Tax=Zoarces viviparus TaxID=48416 RepID=A0AAW1FUI9_ZOAVI